MKKRVLSLLMVACLIVGLLPPQVYAETITEAADITESIEETVLTEGYYTYSVTDGKATITDVDAAISGDITIPSTLDGCPVIEIGSNAFQGCTGLTAITIPDSITEIGYKAFYGCSGLTSVTFGSGVFTIGDSSFEMCSGLTSIVIPDNVYTLGQCAFRYCYNLTDVTVGTGIVNFGDQVFRKCTGLTNVTLRDGLSCLGSRAFQECTGLINITIPGSVSEIRTETFYRCSNLKELTIGEGVTVIGNNAFYECESLETISIPDSVTSIGEWVFYKCKSATTATIGSGVSSVGSYAFGHCYNLTDVTIRDGATCIGGSMFSSCEKLTNVTIPDSVTTIGGLAFSNCYALTGLTIPAGVTSLGGMLVDGCTSLSGIWVDEENPNYSSDTYGVLFNKDKTTLLEAPDSMDTYTVPDGTNKIENYAFYNDYLTNIAISDSVTSIGDYAFCYCGLLSEITIADSVESIGDWAFYGCTFLETVNYNGRENQWDVISIGSENGCLLNAQINFNENEDGGHTFGDWEKVNASSHSRTCSECGETETETHNYVDGICTGCGDMYYTYTVTDGEATITGCNTAISGDITIPATLDGYSVTAIGNNAFKGCTRLTSVVIPDGVTAIPYGAFWGCENLTTATLPDGVTRIGGYAFYNCYSLSSANIPEGVTKIDIYAFCSTSLTDIILPDSLITIGDSAFRSCDMETITIPASVTEIEQYAFSYCSNLTGIFVDEENTVYSSDDSGVLFNKDKTVLIVAPNAISGVYAIPEGVITIEADAFYGCDGLTGVTISDSVTTIESEAFCWCEGLTSVNIPAGVTSIGSNAFRGCSSLTGIFVDKENAVYSSDDRGVLFDKEKTTLIQAPGGISGMYMVPAGVTSIDGYAFYYCENVSGLSIPESVTYIGGYAFYSCYALRTVCYRGTETQWNAISFGGSNSYLANAVRHYNDYSDWTKVDDATHNRTCATCGAVEIVEHNFVNGICTTCGDMYYTYTVANDEATITDCNTAISGDIMIPATLGGYPVTNIGMYAFSGCKELTGITFEGNVTFISAYAFQNCTGLTSITIPSEVSYILANTFKGCTSLMDVTIPNTVTSIGRDAFCGCTALTGITIPNSVTSIDYNAFAECTALTDITIPDSMTSIADSVFYECTGLVSITIPTSVTSIGSAAFSACTGLKTVYYTGTEEQWNAVAVDEFGNSALLNAEIVFAAAEECSHSYGDWEKVDDDTHSRTCTLCGEAETEDHTFVNTVCSGCGNTDGYTYTVTDGNATITGYKGTISGDITFPSTLGGCPVTAIGEYAFEDCINLTGIQIPNSVTSIGSNAFECTGLTSVTIPDSVTSLGHSVFALCHKLTSVKLSNRVSSIGFNAFLECESLTSITIPTSVTSIGNGAFACCTSLETVAYEGTRAQWNAIEINDNGNDVLLNAEMIYNGTEVCDHTYSDWTKVDDATHSHICTLCGEEETENHNYTGVVTAPNCIDKGYTTYTCTCGDSYVADYVNTADHSYDTTVTYPTCTEAGLITGTCFYCGYSFSIITPAYGHQYSEAITAPTCTAKGYTTYTCTCGDSYVSDEVPALGHSYQTAVTAPTCGEQGYTTYTCATCGHSYIADHTEAPAHSYDTTVTLPTCTEAGQIICTCTTCGDSFTIPTPAPGHSHGEQTDCTVAVNCSVCGIEVYAAKEHTYDNAADKECNDCGAVNSDGPVVDSKLNFQKHTINMKSSLKLSFRIENTAIADASDFYVVFHKAEGRNEQNVTMTLTKEDIGAPASNGYYYAEYPTIPVCEMGVKIEATLYVVDADGKVRCSEVDRYSVADYLYLLLDSYIPSATVPDGVYYKNVQVAVELLNFGAEAQKEFKYKEDQLVTARLTDKELSFRLAEDPVPVNNRNWGANNGEVRFESSNLDLKEKIYNQIRINVANLTSAQKESLRVVVKYQANGKVLQSIPFSEFQLYSENRYYVPITEINPSNMTTIFTVQVFVGTKAVSSVATYSVESYVKLAVDAKISAAAVSMAALRYGTAVAKLG